MTRSRMASASVGLPRGLVFEQQGEPLGVFEGARFGIVIEFLEALCHAMQAERMQLIESGMGQHSSFSVSSQWGSEGREHWDARTASAHYGLQRGRGFRALRTCASDRLRWPAPFLTRSRPKPGGPDPRNSAVQQAICQPLGGAILFSGCRDPRGWARSPSFACQWPARQCGRETMEDPISPARRTLLKAGAVTLATPVAAAIAQPAAAPGHQEAKTFDLWVISDQHVGTDKAASEGIQQRPGRISAAAGARRVARHCAAPVGGGRCLRRAALQLGYRAQSRRLCGLLGCTGGRAGGRGGASVCGPEKTSPRAGLQYRRQPRRLAPTGTPRTRARRRTGGSANGATRSGSTRRPRGSIRRSGLIRSTAPGSATLSRSAISAS